MSEINLNELSSDELKEQARVLEISLKGNLSDDTIRERIREKLGIEPEDNEPAIAAKGAGTVAIMISEDENDRQPVFVGVNGKSYRIKRGVKVDVPAGVVEVLKNCTQRVKRGDEWTTRPTYPFQIVG